MKSKAIKNILPKLSDRSNLFIMDRKRTKFVNAKQQEIEWKPNGLWYASGKSWISWCLSEQSNWIGSHIYKIHLNRKKILQVKTVKQLDKFHLKYKSLPEFFPKNLKLDMMSSIDWKKIAKRYYGVEISPYFYARRFHYSWYYSWDVASGCIWNKKAIRKIQLIMKYDKKKRKFHEVING